ncbi:NnrS family protein [Marinihelvus fidelis]|uniref:NnrS family protein n=1 Tax=Marinihelvus fidelis TaxID=2613842 RepID=UPI0017813486|nr:NnrS family protein [Marinihelvus fidelis]
MTLFAYGFRPFFLLAGWFAVVGLGGWLLIFQGRMTWSGGLPVTLWHGHEMLFGFVTAAIAGFMLTAVPSWTGTRGFGGWPLVALVALWLAGRVVFAMAGSVPYGILAVLELTFLPALAAMIAPALLRSRNRNTKLLLVLLALWAADVVFMTGLRRGDAALSGASLTFALNLVLLLITVIGGRIVPAFTANALRQRSHEPILRAVPWLERLVILAMVALLVIDVVLPMTTWAGVIAVLAGLAQAARLSRWNGQHTLAEPIVWILHLAYAWLPVGLLLKAAFLLGGFSWAAFWMHALGAGATATMILAVMSRASLGHTGRELRVPPIMTVSYLMVTLAAALRVFGPAVLPFAYGQLITIAGLLWMASFLVFALVYTPILLRPRVDGKPG